MATVVFSGELERLAGEPRASIEASTYLELIRALSSRFPALDAAELQDMAIAIDGLIIQEPAFSEPVGADAEVHFLQRIEGG